MTVALKTEADLAKKRCRLCLQVSDLRNSHIVSKFLWKNSGLFGHHKKVDVPCLSHPDESEYNLQDGFKERLLCDDCERKLGRHEHYAREAMFAKSGPLRQWPSGHYHWTGLDYKAFKLFQMAQLWRMGVCSHPYYAHVDLGKHEEILRRMLLSEDPGEPWQYGFVAELVEASGVPMRSLFAQPRQYKRNERHWYYCIIAGMHVRIYVGKTRPNEMFCRMFLQPDGTWMLFRSDISKFPYLREIWNELRERMTKKSARKPRLAS